jgi:hypothetical protein
MINWSSLLLNSLSSIILFRGSTRAAGAAAFAALTDRSSGAFAATPRQAQGWRGGRNSNDHPNVCNAISYTAKISNGAPNGVRSALPVILAIVSAERARRIEYVAHFASPGLGGVAYYSSSARMWIGRVIEALTAKRPAPMRRPAKRPATKRLAQTSAVRSRTSRTRGRPIGALGRRISRSRLS